MALIWYEFQKVWRKGSFLGLMFLILILNLFLLWYFNRPAEEDAALSSYKAVCREISGMTEEEKMDYISGMEDTALKDELYGEISAVSGYEEYLESVQETAAQLGGISIFQPGEKEEDFVSRNIQKSAADHAGMTSESIRWFPSKGVVMAAESQITDLFLLLSVFLFVGQLITEEKTKGLFAITRTTRLGTGRDLAARLLALLIHCGIAGIVLYGSNLLFAWSAAGLGDLSAALPSLAPYMQTSLEISVGEFLLLGVLTKIVCIFAVGLFLTACVIFASHSFVPWLAGVGFLGANGLLYALIPSYSRLNLLKYFSFFGILRTDEVYGNYLNLDLAGFPVSRMICTWLVLAMGIMAGGAAASGLFCRGNRHSVTKTNDFLQLPFRFCDSLLRHEGYKILIANRVLFILAAYAVLIVWTDLGKTYAPSAGEQYYQELMLSLEGELTGEKENILKSEQERFEEASVQIERIDNMAAEGIISEDAADEQKEKWYSQLVFYPWFERALEQYDHILAEGGVFVYDTGYLYLSGQLDSSFRLDLLLLSLCFCLAFSNVMAMEDSKGMWGLLAAAWAGRKKVILSKWLVCALISAIMTLLPWICHFLSVSRVYPMGEMLAGIRNIPQYRDFSLDIPVFVFLLLTVSVQMAAVQILSFVIFCLSGWRKNYFQTLFLALLLFAVPLALAEMGLDVMQWFSLWPVYGWPGAL